jgi:hypothetical protein
MVYLLGCTVRKGRNIWLSRFDSSGLPPEKKWEIDKKSKWNQPRREDGAAAKGNALEGES